MKKLKWPLCGVLSLSLFLFVALQVTGNNAVEPCLKNTSSICDKNHQLNPKALKYFERQWSKKLVTRQITQGLGKDKNKNHWSIGANLRSYLELFEVTRKPEYLDFVAQAGIKIIERRDDKKGLKDQLRNNKVFPGWGSRLSKNAYKRSVSLDQNLALLYPLAMFTRIVGTHPHLKKKHNETLKFFTQEIITTLNAFDADWNLNQGYYGAPKKTKDINCFKIKKKISRALIKKCLKHKKIAQASKPLPYHVQSMAGLVFLELNAYLQFEYYIDRLQKISIYLNKNFEREINKNTVYNRWTVEYISKYKRFKNLFAQLKGGQLFTDQQLSFTTQVFKKNLTKNRSIASISSKKTTLRATGSWFLFAKEDTEICNSMRKIISHESRVTALNFTRMIGQCGDLEMKFSWIK